MHIQNRDGLVIYIYLTTTRIFAYCTTKVFQFEVDIVLYKFQYFLKYHLLSKSKEYVFAITFVPGVIQVCAKCTLSRRWHLPGKSFCTAGYVAQDDGKEYDDCDVWSTPARGEDCNVWSTPAAAHRRCGRRGRRCGRVTCDGAAPVRRNQVMVKRYVRRRFFL